MKPLIIDLSKEKLFNTDSIILDKRINYFFGKNGTGKSTFARIVKEQLNDYEVCVFQGFDSLMAENNRLNAVSLGEKNSSISKKISIIEKNIYDLNKEKELITERITKPEDGSINNLWTKEDAIKKEYYGLKKEIDSFYIESARIIKNLSDPQIASPSYDKNDFKDDIDNAKELSSNEVDRLIRIIKTDIKIVPDVTFPSEKLSNLLEKVNCLLCTKVEEKKTIIRIGNNTQKRDFAKFGLELHKAGDVCAFCGGTVKPAVIEELDGYFSANEVKKFHLEIDEVQEQIKKYKKQVEGLQLLEEWFYPEYSERVIILINDLENKKNRIIGFLSELDRAIENKKKELFNEMDKLDYPIPEDLSSIISDFYSLKEDNNSNDIKREKEKAKDTLRYYEVKKRLVEYGYEKKKSKFDVLGEALKDIKDEIERENNKILGDDGIDSKIRQYEKDIEELKKQTVSEVKLIYNIKRKLLNTVSFELVHCTDEESKGFYQIKEKETDEIRDINTLSTGEKNIIAFLYFIEKLNEVKTGSTQHKRVIVFDDPMSSNDDDMQYLMIEELLKIQENNREDYFIILTHNKHFYININYYPRYKEDNHFRFQKKYNYTEIKKIKNEKDDFKTSYSSLWIELDFFYKTDNITANMLLNPMRRIIETFTKFNCINLKNFLSVVPGAKKILDTNSHSIDDLETDLNGKEKEEILQMFCDCFIQNNYKRHLENHWKSISIDDDGKVRYSGN